MEIIFWTFLGLVAFIYFGYPLFFFFLDLFSEKKKEKVYPQIFPKVSLIIPAHNEERVIETKINNALSLDYPKDRFEIIVALDGCTDKTEEIVSKYSNEGIRKLNGKMRRGKAEVINQAVAEASGEIIVFTDANTIFKKDAVNKLVRRFSEQGVGCVCGDLRYFSCDNSSVAQGEGLYWKYERALKMKESSLGSVLVTNGSIYGIRRKLFTCLDADIADDFIIPMRVAKRGFKVVFEPEAVALEKITRDFREEFRQKTRIIAQGFKASIRYFDLVFSCGFLRIFSFLLHKFLRWLVPLFLVIIFISNILIVWSEPSNRGFGFIYKLCFGLQIIFYFSALIGFFRVKKGRKIKGVFYIPFYFSLVNLASLVGLLKSFTTSRTDIWEKAETTR